MTTELVLLGTAGAPLPVAGRAGICSAVVFDGRVFVIDCGRGAPSGFAAAGLDFSRLEAVFLTHLHADHVGDLPGMLLYGWGARVREDWPLAPIRVYGPSRPETLPEGDAIFHRQTTICPQGRPRHGGPDRAHPGRLRLPPERHAAGRPHAGRGRARPGHDIAVPGAAGDIDQVPVVVFDDGILRVTAVAVTHGRAVPAMAYRFDTPDGSVTFSGDTTVNEDLIALARGADILVHQVADLDYLKQHGTDKAELARMAALHTDVSQVGGVAERARVGELILSHYLPADPAAISAADWARRAGRGFSGTTTAGRDGLRRTLPGQEPAAQVTRSAGAGPRRAGPGRTASR